MKLSLLFLASLLLIRACCGTAAAVNKQAAADLVDRVLAGSGSSATLFAFEACASGTNGEEAFEVDAPSAANGGQVATLRGSTTIALTAAFGWYVKHVANGTARSWGGDQLDAFQDGQAPVFSGAAVRKESPHRYRQYMNVCTHSYSMAWWDWSRWEQELDWMALRGLNMPIVFTGQERLWADTYKAIGLSEEDVEQHFVGPAYLAWGRMGNIRGWMGPLDPQWRLEQSQLQQKILARVRELDMLPVMPSFAGHIPQALKEQHPSADTQRSGEWAGFNDTYSDDFLLRTSDPLFQNITSEFLGRQVKLYNMTASALNADVYNEMVPASNSTDFLKNDSRSLYDAMQAANPGAVWVIQGWMFSFDAGFWQPEQVKAYLGGVPGDGVVVLDLDAYLDPVWSTTDGFYGKPFIWSIINNGGGRRGLYGNLTRIATGPLTALREAPSLAGIGLAMEGIEQNPINYELMAEMGWTTSEPDVDAWVAKYAQARYGLTGVAAAPDAVVQQHDLRVEVLAQSGGQLPPEAAATPSELVQSAWSIMRTNLYDNTGEHNGAIFVDEPALNIGADLDWTNPALTTQAWRLFHQGAASAHAEGAPLLVQGSPFQWDAVDLTRQMLSNMFDDATLFLTAASTRQDAASAKSVGKLLLGILDDLDAVLGTNAGYMLGGWTEAARSWGAGRPEAADRYEVNARMLITLWGGGLEGYAARQLSGLVSDFYRPRWELFVQHVEAAAAAGQPLDQGAFDQACNAQDSAWAHGTGAYPTTPSGDTLALMDLIAAKYTDPAVLDGYVALNNTDSTGDLLNGHTWGTDAAQMAVLCNSDPACVGFNSNGYFKDASTTHVPFQGSTLWVKKAAE